MSFLYPQYFWLLLLPLAFFATQGFFLRRVAAFGYLLTFFFLVIALARPVLPAQSVQSDAILSDVIIAVDLSYSMQATDVEPSRLGFAKERLHELVKSEQKSRFGVLGFTTNAIVLSPLTSDSELLLHLFASLDEKLIITKGSSIMSALELARKMSHSKMPCVLLLTDGADESDYEAEAAFAKENALRVNILMIASDFGTTLRLANGELLKDELDNLVTTRANEAVAHIAQESGGVYSRDFDTIQSALEAQREEDFTTKSMSVVYVELFYYFVFLGLLSFLLSVTTLKRYLIAFVLLFGLQLQGSILNYFEDADRVAFKEANTYYKAGEYEKALSAYGRVKSDNPAFKGRVFYNKANTLVRLGEFEKARESYLKSLTLFYTKEADENLEYIKEAKESKEMQSGQQKTDKKSSIAKEQENSAKQKEGGSSNMKVSASAGSGESKNEKKSAQENIFNMSQGKAKLSSKQYELINKRQIDEKKPY
ncbi:MAG TPA: VWA domain-containing protein [Sulfurimonas sp. UBA12504]|nr:MAG: VWA domain-containing protein [Sulfurimonas sp. GWF2_37_8]DAB30041.1 MAG TPA: VWA domain-containing protein [Sulfurimonas sp. UBA12504]